MVAAAVWQFAVRAGARGSAWQRLQLLRSWQMCGGEATDRRTACGAELRWPLRR